MGHLSRDCDTDAFDPDSVTTNPTSPDWPIAFLLPKTSRILLWWPEQVDRQLPLSGEKRIFNPPGPRSGVVTNSADRPRRFAPTFTATQRYGYGITVRELKT